MSECLQVETHIGVQQVPWTSVDHPVPGLPTNAPNNLQVKREAIPIIFVPGVMGSRFLRDAGGSRCRPSSTIPWATARCPRRPAASTAIPPTARPRPAIAPSRSWSTSPPTSRPPSRPGPPPPSRPLPACASRNPRDDQAHSTPTGPIDPRSTEPPPGGKILLKQRRRVGGFEGIEQRTRLPDEGAGERLAYLWIFPGQSADGAAPRVRLEASAPLPRAGALDENWNALLATWRLLPIGAH